MDIKEIRERRLEKEWNLEKIVALINATKNDQGLFPYVDDHNGTMEIRMSVGHLVYKSDNGREYVGNIPCDQDGTPATVFCINPLYVGEDGKIHLSTMSVGGNVCTVNRTIEDAVTLYNEEREQYPWSTGRIVKYVP